MAVLFKALNSQLEEQNKLVFMLAEEFGHPALACANRSGVYVYYIDTAHA